MLLRPIYHYFFFVQQQIRLFKSNLSHLTVFAPLQKETSRTFKKSLHRVSIAAHCVDLVTYNEMHPESKVKP